MSLALDKLFDVKHQLAFYGAYHTNPINIAIHVFGVPAIMWSWHVLGINIPIPSFIPYVHHYFGPHLLFETNFSTLYAAVYLAYYYALEPLGALIYTPFMAVQLLSACAFARNNGDAMQIATVVHIAAWIAQFAGHGFAERRKPALRDNLLGAVVLAPFFVALELLFLVGYKPAMYKELKNEIGKQVAAMRKKDGDAKRAKEAERAKKL